MVHRLSLEQLEAVLPPLVAASNATRYDLSVNDDVAAVHRPSSAREIVSHCPALKTISMSRGNVQEPLWRAMIGLVKHTIEGAEVAHAWSDGHPAYDYDATQEKFDRYAAGPTTCAHFASHCSECTGCQHRGKIKSPIVLGWTQEATQAPATVGAGQPLAVLKEKLPDWRRTRDGGQSTPMNTSDNLAALARLHHVDIKFNMMTRRAEVRILGHRTESDDHDNTVLTKLGDLAVRAGMNRMGLVDLVGAVAGLNPYHPVGAFIRRVPWDGASRLAEFYDSIELADPTQEHLRGKVLDAMMLQAIGCIENAEGVAASGLVVLNGPQGCGKSRWVESLCPVPGAVQIGVHLNPDDKDSVFHATGSLFTELGEMGSTTRKADVEMLKAFVTRSVDVIRRPYAQTENAYRRRTVFIGTVNGSGFLVDTSGNRRYWVLVVKRCHPLSAALIQAVFAEYLSRYEAGERWHLDAQTQALINELNVDHQVIDPLRERIGTQFDWSAVDGPNWHERTTPQWLSATRVCERVGVANPSRSEATRAGAIVAEMNHGVNRKTNGVKVLALPPARGQQ